MSYLHLTLIVPIVLASTAPMWASEMFLQPWEQRQVPSSTTGMMSEILVDKGDSVEVGTVLVRLDDRAELIARDRAKLELDVARERLASAHAKSALRSELLQIAANA